MANPADKELLIKVRADIQAALKQLHALTEEVQETGAAAPKTASGIAGMTTAARAFLATGAAVVALGLAKRTLAIADAYAGLQTRIRTATKVSGDYLTVSRELLTLSVQNGTALETTVSLFQNLARTAPELQATNSQVLELTNLVQQLGVIGGSSQGQLQAGLMQFTQGLAGGVFRAEEFNSILENLPELASRLALGMGKTVGELRQAVIDGKVLSKDVFDALIKQAPEIAREFENIPPTIEGAMGSLGTAISARIGEINKQLGVTATLAEGIKAIAEGIAPDSVGEVQQRIGELVRQLDAIDAGLDTQFQRLGETEQLRVIERLTNELIELRAQVRPGGAGVAPIPVTKRTPEQIELSKNIAEATAKFREQMATIDGTNRSAIEYLTTVGKFKDATAEEKQSLLAAAVALDEKAAATKRAQDATTNSVADQKVIADLTRETELAAVSEAERERIQNRLQYSTKLSATATDEYRQKVELLADRLLKLREAAAYARQLLDLERQILRTTNPAEADRQDLLDKFLPALTANALQGDAAGASTIDSAAGLERRQADFQRIAADRVRIMEQLSTQETRINTDREAGLISALEAQRRIVELHQQTARSLDAQLPAMRELAGALGPDAVAAVERYAEENRKLGLVVDRNAQRIRDGIEGGLVQGFEDVILQTKSMGQAFEDFGKTVLKTLARIAAERATLAVMEFFGFKMPTKADGGQIQTKASGGLLRGPGTGTSDSIPAWVSNGEYVVRAAAVRKLGLPFMEAVNDGHLPIPDISRLMPRYASGGLVGTGVGGTMTLGGTVVQIINQTGAQVRHEGTVGVDAEGRTIERIVISAVAGDIENGGKVAAAVQRTFGLKRSGRSS
jgi:tape measure domain-containing protein